jgi:polyisoprenoid-binding protein YceI
MRDAMLRGSQHRHIPTLGIAALLVLLGGGARAADVPAWRIARGDVRVYCPMTVGGGFEAETRALTGELSLPAPQTAAFAGAVAVDLRTLDTGIALRDEHLRDEYLQVEHGPEFRRAVLSDISLGDVDPPSFEGRTVFTGTLQLHAVKHTIGGTARVRRDGAEVHLDASFSVILSDYGIPKPRYLGIGVEDQVEVKVDLVAEPLQGEP